MSSKKTKPAAAAAAARQDIDERFAPLLKDAKFRPSKSINFANKKPTSASNSKKKDHQAKKIVVDDRFKAMFEGEEFKSKPVLDRYGRKSKATTTKSESFKDISRHYTLDKHDESRLEELNQLARGIKGDGDASSSESDEEEAAMGSSDEDDDDVMDQTAEVHFDSDAITKLELSDDSSARLACVGCDWDKIRAVDLLAILNSFVPPVGAILRVSIYPTQFGRERLLMEEENGPLSHTATVIVDDEEDEDGGNIMGNKFNPELLRKYEKERLLYYVAVIECDSKETAEAVYKECDGLEFEHSSIALDLRFIPADIQFDSSLLRDSSEEVPDEYQGPEDFVNKSLQQTNVSLSWDDAKQDRAKLHEWGTSDSKKKNAGVSMDELEAFIASSDDDEDEEDEQRAIAVQKYRALLLQGPEDGDEQYKDEEEEAEIQPNIAVSSKRNNKPAPVVAKQPQEEPEKPKKKSKKTKKRKEEDGEQEQAEVDIADERLAGLFNDPEFMLDQTDPRYKATQTNKKINEERRKRIKIRD